MNCVSCCSYILFSLLYNHRHNQRVNYVGNVHSVLVYQSTQLGPYSSVVGLLIATSFNIILCFFNYWVWLSLCICIPCSFLAAVSYITLFVKGRKDMEESTTLDLSNKSISDSDWGALKTISVLLGSFLPFFLPFYGHSLNISMSYILH